MAQHLDEEAVASLARELQEEDDDVVLNAEAYLPSYGRGRIAFTTRVKQHWKLATLLVGVLVATAAWSTSQGHTQKLSPGKPNTVILQGNAAQQANAQAYYQQNTGSSSKTQPPSGKEAPPPPPPAAPETTPAPVGECVWEGHNCMGSKCCKRKGYSCFQKDDKYAGCGDTCENLKKFTGDPNWSCQKLGGSAEIPVIAPSTDNPAGTSLFCFVVVTPQGVVPPGVKPGYEQQVISAIEPHGAGIFACDDHAQFTGMVAAKGDWRSIVNTDIFIKTWHEVQADGRYKQHDWTVKVDVDAVFFPDRLKMHIQGAKPPADTPMYFKNIDYRFGFMGSLEILSAGAVDAFLANAEDCKKHIGTSGGEDFFTMQCLDASGVGHMRDNSLLDDKYTRGDGWHLYDVDPCTDDSNVAFHPYKAVNSWMGCYNVAMKIQTPDQFVGCTQRWHDDACSLSSQLTHEAGGIGVPSLGV